MSYPMGARHRCKDLTQSLSAFRLLLLVLVLLLTDIDGSHGFTIDGKLDDNSGDMVQGLSLNAKDSTSSINRQLIVKTGINVIQKLIKYLINKQNMKRQTVDNKAIGSVDGLASKSDDQSVLPKKHFEDLIDLEDILTGDMKVHMHHIFPPQLIRPLQKVIIQKLIHMIRHPPVKKYKRKMKRVAKMSTLAVIGTLGVKEIKELKSRPPIVQYSVTGLEDLSGHKKAAYYEHKKRERRDDNIDDELYDVTKDSGDPDYKLVTDYKLTSEKSRKNHWPFHETKDEIYEKWNKFPAPEKLDPFHQKVKYIHRSFHELSPDIHHLVQDVHGLVGTKTKVIHTGPELESPIVLAGQFLKLLDSLIPSIRIRIPFVEYLVKSFHQKSKPKVIYVKQKPKIQYVGVPYHDDRAGMDTMDAMGAHEPGKPIEIEVPITVPVPEPIIVPEPSPEQNGYKRLDNQLRPHFYSSNQLNENQDSFNSYQGHEANLNHNIPSPERPYHQYKPYMTQQTNHNSHKQSYPGGFEPGISMSGITVYKDSRDRKA